MQEFIDKLQAMREKQLEELERDFGYRPKELDGEKWCIFKEDTLIVVHADRLPRFYKRGCGGACYELVVR